MNRWTKMCTILGLAAWMAFLGTMVFAENKAPELANIQFTAEKYDNTGRLGPAGDAVALAVGDTPGVTFRRDGVILYVGVPDLKTPITAYFSSDCPNNSQFTVQGPIVQNDLVRRATIAWTRHRHDSTATSVKVVNIRQLSEDDRFNYDIQLNM